MLWRSPHNNPINVFSKNGLKQESKTYPNQNPSSKHTSNIYLESLDCFALSLSCETQLAWGGHWTTWTFHLSSGCLNNRDKAFIISDRPFNTLYILDLTARELATRCKLLNNQETTFAIRGKPLSQGIACIICLIWRTDQRGVRANYWIACDPIRKSISGSLASLRTCAVTFSSPSLLVLLLACLSKYAARVSVSERGGVIYDFVEWLGWMSWVVAWVGWLGFRGFCAGGGRAPAHLLPRCDGGLSLSYIS
jgi:hypothetical protein